jgi:hypothetical protein
MTDLAPHTIVLLVVWGTVVALDLVSVPQAMLSRPLVAGTVCRPPMRRPRGGSSMRKLVVSAALIVAAFGGWGWQSRAGGQPRVVVDDLYHAVTTLRDVNSLGIAVEAYWQDHREYPRVTTAAELVKLLAPTYAAHLESQDAWGTDIKYLPSPDHQDYRLVSAGSDRRFEEATWSVAGVFTDSKQDALFSDHFLRKWSIDFP